MKMKLMVCTLLLASTAANAGIINCQGKDSNGDVLTLEGRLITDWIKNAKATAISDGKQEIGRSAQLESVDNSRARKYKDYTRFELDKLTEVRNFGRFMPWDQCSIKVFIPNNAMAKKSFQAPVTVNCDQSGGAMTLSCDHDNSQD